MSTSPQNHAQVKQQENNERGRCQLLSTRSNRNGDINGKETNEKEAQNAIRKGRGHSRAEGETTRSNVDDPRQEDDERQRLKTDDEKEKRLGVDEQ